MGTGGYILKRNRGHKTLSKTLCIWLKDVDSTTIHQNLLNFFAELTSERNKIGKNRKQNYHIKNIHFFTKTGLVLNIHLRKIL